MKIIKPCFATSLGTCIYNTVTVLSAEEKSCMSTRPIRVSSASNFHQIRFLFLHRNKEKLWFTLNPSRLVNQAPSVNGLH